VRALMKSFAPICGFRLHAADLGDPEPGCTLGVLQQRRFPDPGLPSHYKCLSLPGPGGPEQTFERRAFRHERERAIRSPLLVERSRRPGSLSSRTTATASPSHRTLRYSG
jgi:hypothetical protein